MLSHEVRQKFLQYFKNNQHAIISSSPVLPHGDPTLLFTNAGMNQFKDVFLGNSVRDYKRAATSQKCIRVGGKHNDLDNVGHTSRHLTFFEMLGNFSFGDYFKKEAVKFAWEVSTQVFGFEPERIWPTVYKNDDEAFELWSAYVPADRITRFGEKENFWAMGDTGPCGPSSELLYDRGEKFGIARHPGEDADGERFLEYWNIVFMQHNRSASGSLDPLPKPSIDTGAGLERIIDLSIGAESVFETDILRSLIAQVENISGLRYNPADRQLSPAFRVIADHLRCLAFAIADGVQPGNVERGYVLRKVLRRAVRYGRTLGLEEPFMARVLPRLVDTMGKDFPELGKNQSRIADILTLEEEAFIRTLRRGGNILNQIIEQAKERGMRISGDDAFKLKDTYGFPIEEILLLAKDGALTVDTERYQELEQGAKERSRSVQKTTQQIAAENLFESFAKEKGESRFLGYTQHTAVGKVAALVVNGEFTDCMQEGQEGMVILDQTPFYAEMGGQIGDIGVLKGEHGLFQVADCTSPFKGIIAHGGKLERGTLKLGATVVAAIDAARRQKIANNHTATHLLHWALQKVLGEHIKQAGSVVDPQRLRFDFSHHKALTHEEIHKIEDLINAKIRENLPVRWYEIAYEDAQKRADIKQFFGEKYGAKVRVVDIDYSKELCGGTHTTQLGNIGLFRITKEGSIAAGVRRIEAQTGPEAEKLERENASILESLAASLKTQVPKLPERIEKLLEEIKLLQHELKQSRKEQIEAIGLTLMQKLEQINEKPSLIAQVALPPEELKVCADALMAKLHSGVLILASASDDKCSLIARASEDLVGKGVKVNEILKAIAPIIEGSGGGRPASAQAGGKAPQKIAEALAKARELL